MCFLPGVLVLKLIRVTPEFPMFMFMFHTMWHLFLPETWIVTSGTTMILLNCFVIGVFLKYMIITLILRNVHTYITYLDHFQFFAPFSPPTFPFSKKTAFLYSLICIFGFLYKRNPEIFSCLYLPYFI